jgi:integrase/recombinase XerD
MERERQEKETLQDFLKEEQIIPEELVKDFLAEEKLKGRTRQGLRTLKKNLPRFIRYLDENGPGFRELKARDAQNYQLWLVETGRKDGRPYNAGTVLNYIKAAARFYGYLKTKGEVMTNPFREIKKIRYPKHLVKNVLKEGEMNRLLARLSQYYQQKTIFEKILFYKVHVIAELQYSTGLRISEAAELKEEDIDFGKSMIRVRQGKGLKERMVFLNEYARGVLKLYVEEMKDLVLGGYERRCEGIFGAYGPRLGNDMKRVFQKVMPELEIDFITSHGFRHSLGYHLLRAGCDIRYIQEILGHESLGTTEIYTKIEKSDLRKVLDDYHPRKWREK